MPPTSPRPSETRRADISDVRAISRKSGVKTVRSRVMLIRRTPWSQGLRRDLECLSFLINFLRRRILHPVISERMGGNPLPQCARSCSDMKRREARRPQRGGCRSGTESRLNPPTIVKRKPGLLTLTSKVEQLLSWVQESWSRKDIDSRDS